MKKILLTGHTSGLGKALYDFYSPNHDVIGISRSTGYDLTSEDTVRAIADQAMTCDVVLNVAKVQPAQNLLLLKVIKQWKENNHCGHIISIGSIGTNFNRDTFNDWLDAEALDYLAHKKELENIHNDLAYTHPFNKQPRSTLIKPFNIGAKEGDRSNEPYCSQADIVELVDMCINSRYWISTLEVRQTW